MILGFSQSGLGRASGGSGEGGERRASRAADAAVPVPKLVPLVRPFFDFVCQARMELDAGAGEFGGKSAEDLTTRVDLEIEQIRSQKNAAPELAALIRDGDVILEDLRAFATWILASGPTDTSKTINALRRRRDPVQDESFTDHLRAELKSVNPSTTERLVVYAICLGLGYRGVEEDQTIRRLRSEIWGHVQRIVPSPRREHERSPGCQPLFPGTYEINTNRLDTPPVRWWIVYLASALAIAAIVVAVVAVRSVGVERDSAIELLNLTTSAQQSAQQSSDPAK